MIPTLIDSNILVDLLKPAAEWHSWAVKAIRALEPETIFVINPLIYAEVSVGYATPDQLDADLPEDVFVREALPWDAAFAAGKAFLAYRRRGGTKSAPLPAFYIGAHAEVAGYRLLTRDAARYRTYFPALELISP